MLSPHSNWDRFLLPVWYHDDIRLLENFRTLSIMYPFECNVACLLIGYHSFATRCEWAKKQQILMQDEDWTPSPDSHIGLDTSTLHTVSHMVSIQYDVKTESKYVG